MKEGLYMSTLTKNYGLEKPAQTDFYDVDVFNRNADIIDEALKGNGVELSVTDGILNATHESGATAQIADKPTLDEILALLENTTYGLNALKNVINNKNVDLTPITNQLSNTTYGLSAIKTAINGRANESTLTATKALLENTTYGLSAIKSTVGLGCVKSVQRGIIMSDTPASGSIFNVINTNTNSGAPYVDVTINSVNMNKSIVLMQILNFDDNNDYIGQLTSNTNLRVYYREFGGETYVTTNTVGWQVIEFY